MMLPDLRTDLKLLSGPKNTDGSPTWTIHDPLRNCFFRIGELEYFLLKNWELKKTDTILRNASKQLGVSCREEKIKALLDFLQQNHLLAVQTQEQLLTLSNKSKKQNFSQRFVSLFFFRIPLFKPERFLNVSYPYLAFLFKSYTLYLILLTGILGFYFSIREWHIISTTVVSSYDSGQFYFFLLALVTAKIVHELAHAFTAKHFGCRVAQMGIAFMFFWPVLYTETNEAWKLKSRQSQLAINAAGVIAELGLALMATFLWVFFPDGVIRTGLIMLATVTWLSTLLINLNPFMRFDGYYLLADLLAVPNLQERSFKLARWYLRETLFNYQEPKPEQFPLRKQRLLIFYAYCTWLYRFFLYLGIALLVYHFLFKLAGIIIMSLELTLFIALPVYREMSLWWSKRKKIRFRASSFLFLMAIIGLILLLILPWQSQKTVPAVLTSKAFTQIYPVYPAKLKKVHVRQGQKVKQGELLIELYSPDIEHRLRQNQSRIESLTWEINQAGSNLFSLRNSRVLESELLAALTEQQGIRKQRLQLIITAPWDGEITSMMEGLTTDRWYSTASPLIELTDASEQMVYAYIEESLLNRIEQSKSSVFIPDNYDLAIISLTPISTDKTALKRLSKLHQLDVFGGPIQAVKNDSNEYVPLKSIYRRQFSAKVENISLTHELKGVVSLNLVPQSLISQLWTNIKAIVIRESGF